MASTASGSGSLKQSVRLAATASTRPQIDTLETLLNLGRLCSGPVEEQSRILMRDLSELDDWPPPPKGSEGQQLGFVQQHLDHTTVPRTLRLGFGLGLHDCLCFGWMRALHRQGNPGVTHLVQRIRPDLLYGGRLAETWPNPDFALDGSWETASGCKAPTAKSSPAEL